MHVGVFVFTGNPCPYVIEDQNEDTISALVRLITEKKGILFIFVHLIYNKEEFVYVMLAKTLCVFNLCLENAAALEELLLEYEKKETCPNKRSSVK